MKSIGNSIARFKNIYLRKVTKRKFHGAFTCLLIVCKVMTVCYRKDSICIPFRIAPYDNNKRFWRRRSLKMVDDGPWLYYKLNEPKVSGELKNV